MNEQIQNQLANSPIVLEQVSIINWDALGIRPYDLVGWTFSSLNSSDPNQAIESIEQVGVVVHLPITIHYRNGQLHFDSDLINHPFHLVKDWTQCIFKDGDRIIVKLPLYMLPERSSLVITPPEGVPTSDQVKIMTSCHDSKAPEITVCLFIHGNNTTIPAGTPLAHIVPIALSEVYNPQGQQTLPVQEPPVNQMPENLVLHQESDTVSAPETAGSFIPPDFNLTVWRLHPRGVRIEAAEKTLRGDAPTGAITWCGPFTHANAYGFWLYPPLDLDIIWYGGRSFDYKVVTPYSDDDIELVRNIERPEDRFHYSRTPRTKIDFGGVVENVVSIWTGCVFQTPPGWSLMIRNPINVSGNTVFRIQEGILETDWLSYDIWMNLQFLQQDRWVHLRKDQNWPPVAQIIPVRREGYDKSWKLQERYMERETPEGSQMYDRWQEYNYKKWIEKDNTKNSSTYYLQRAQFFKNQKGE